MPSDVLSDKRHVHELIERLAPSQIAAVRGLLEAMLDPVALAIAAARPDDEPVTEEDLRRVREGEAWLKEHGGRGIPMKDVLAEFGITVDDLSPR